MTSRIGWGRTVHIRHRRLHHGLAGAILAVAGGVIVVAGSVWGYVPAFAGVALMVDDHADFPWVPERRPAR
jgi:hypothetical protein